MQDDGRNLSVAREHLKGAYEEIIRAQHRGAGGRVHVCATLPVFQPQHDAEHAQHETTFRDQAQQYGDQAKAAVSSEPDKSVDKAKAQVHKAKAKHHARNAKEAAKDIPK